MGCHLTSTDACLAHLRCSILFHVGMQVRKKKTASGLCTPEIRAVKRGSEKQYVSCVRGQVFSSSAQQN